MVAGDDGKALMRGLVEASHASMTRRGLEAALEAKLVEEGPLTRLQLGWAPAPPDLGGVVLTLSDSEGGAGYLSYEPPAAIPNALRAEVAAVLSLGQQTVRRFERVAEVSRQAHARAAAIGSAPRGLICRSPAMRAVAMELEAVAPHPTTVLLRGASGTGKERIARELHRRSARRGAFVAVNSGALPDALLESELFGHEEGAFTGAIRRRRGRFEQAQEGTLFLDEVGELSPSAQVRLLRVLEEHVVTPVGSERAVPVDARVVAATHRPLEDMVADGRFREDLFFRLTPFELVLPTLAERPEDLPDLVDELVREHSRRLRRVAPRVPAALIAELAQRTFVGNVRELSNLIERALILNGGPALVLPAPSAPAARKGRRRVSSFDDASREIIVRALRDAGGKIYGDDGAAARLRLKPSTLQGKMKKLGVRRDDVS